MRYVYMNNFRGFQNALIPLKQTNFLVGENSTGKSSFLAILNLISQPSFWIYPEFSLEKETGFSSFRDIVSAWAPDKSSFEVGIVIIDSEKKTGKVDLSFSIHSFVEKGSTPGLSAHTQFRNGKLVAFIFENTRTKFKTSNPETKCKDEEQAVREFWRIKALAQTQDKNFTALPKDVPPQPPLPVVASIVSSIESGEKISKDKFQVSIPIAMDLTWIAPIRSKPRRIYDGLEPSYSPEGDHAPNVLRRSIKSRKFAEKLSEFGKASGLFTTVEPHSFGKGKNTPFELLVKFKGAALNINNVGYGVSQSLPLIVEFLSGDKKKAFAVQQPEVHLHPKAQAALGGLIFEVAKEMEHSFFIETHSDYLIDRYRLTMGNTEGSPDSQVIFFSRTDQGNTATTISISNFGHYSQKQPTEFRDFFIKEEIKLLDL